MYKESNPYQKPFCDSFKELFLLGTFLVYRLCGSFHATKIIMAAITWKALGGHVTMNSWGLYHQRIRCTAGRTQCIIESLGLEIWSRIDTPGKNSMTNGSGRTSRPCPSSGCTIIRLHFESRSVLMGLWKKDQLKSISRLMIIGLKAEYNNYYS